MRCPERAKRRGALVLAAMLSGAAPAMQAQAAADSGASAAAPARALSTTVSYTGDLMRAASGGARRGTTFDGAAAVQGTLLLERAIGWRGARLFAFVMDTHGGAPSNLVGDLQGVSNLQAPPALRLEEFWLQQNLWANRVSWLVGRYDLNSEFYRVQSGALFLNSSFGIGPEFAQSGVAGPSIYPLTAVGTRADFKPSANVVWRAALLDGLPVDRPGGGIHLFARGDGLQLIGEVAVVARPDSAGEPRDRRFRIGRGAAHPYARKIAIGAWYYTARFPDLSDTLANGAPVQHHGSRGAYVVADETVWSAGGGSPRSVTVFAQLGVGDARLNQIGSYVSGGITLVAPSANRPQDQLGLAVAAARNGSHFLRTQTASGVSTAAEITVELTYYAQVTTWLTLQPDLQYVIHPGATLAFRNAIVPGIRIAASR